MFDFHFLMMKLLLLGCLTDSDIDGRPRPRRRYCIFILCEIIIRVAIAPREMGAATAARPRSAGHHNNVISALLVGVEVGVPSRIAVP